MRWLPTLIGLLALAALSAAGWFMFDDPKGVAPDLVANLGWGALLGMVAGTVLAMRRSDDPVSAAGPGVTGALCGVAALVAISFAVAAERQNYWDAYHFAALFWAGALSTVTGLVGLWRSRHESGLASFVLAPAAVVALAYVVLWSWMTFWTVQEVEGAIVRWTWRLTHG